MELKERLILHRELGYESGFEEPDLELRTEPAMLLPEARSIIVIAVAYPSKLKDAPVYGAWQTQGNTVALSMGRGLPSSSEKANGETNGMDSTKGSECTSTVDGRHRCAFGPSRRGAGRNRLERQKLLDHYS